MRSLVIGASAGVGRALCEALSKKGIPLLIMARDARDLDALAAHLQLVYNADIQTIAADASRVRECIDLVGKAASTLGDIDSLYFPIGTSSTEDLGSLSIKQTDDILNTNLVVIIGLISYFLPHLLRFKSANIVGFGSIAAIRGRKVNVVYSVAKRGLESYFESLRHLTASSGVRIQFYRLGYAETQQSFGKRLLFPAVTPQKVAHEVLKNLGKDIGKRSYPRYWLLIAFVLMVLPWRIFKKLNF